MSDIPLNQEFSRVSFEATQNQLGIKKPIPDANSLSHLLESNLVQIGSGIYYSVYDIPDSQFVIKVPHQNYGSSTNLPPDVVDVKVRHEHEIVASHMQDQMPLTQFYKVSNGKVEKQVIVQERVSGTVLSEFEKDPNRKPSIELQNEFQKFATSYKHLTLNGYTIESNQFMINLQENRIYVYDTNELESFYDKVLELKPFLEKLNIGFEGSNIDQFWKAIAEKLPELNPREVENQRAFIFELQSYTKLFKKVLTRIHTQFPGSGATVSEGLKQLFSTLSKFTPSDFDLNIQTAVLAVKLNL